MIITWQEGKKLYREGTWFAIPFPKRTWVVGVVARHTDDGTILCYYFGPRRKKIPEMSELIKLKAKQNVDISFSGDGNIQDGKWKVIGDHPNWDRHKWPLPKFFRGHDIEGIGFLTTYDEQLNRVREEKCDISLRDKYPSDGMDGLAATRDYLMSVIK